MSISVDIRKDFGGFTLQVAFEAENEVLGLLGASGCGKSMTLKCIAGVVTPDEGRIVLDGVTLFDSKKGINLRPQDRHVGLLFQNYALFPNMNVRQNIMTGLCRMKDAKEKDRIVRDIMDRFYLTELEKHRPYQLSGGQQQRVALARILVSKPKILMLDEPFSALDSYLRWEMEMELRQVLDSFEGPTLLVSHDRDEVYRLCEKVCVVTKGVSEDVVTTKELFENPGTTSAALLSGCKNIVGAIRLSSHEIEVPDWGFSIKTRKEVPEDLSSVGIRAKDILFSTVNCEENVIKCLVECVTREPFYTIYTLRPIREGKKAARWIRMDVEKHQPIHFAVGDIVPVGLSEENILLLRG